MLDYVIIKSDDETWESKLKSTAVEGLIIASLPPITRAERRVLIDSVDGRDGDIITDLGYSAYDKVLGVGLYGHYDTQEILDYFKDRGQIVFSSEPDKYYEYEIIKQIDLERVIRFKKGEITFHVQPYKYPVYESKITLTSAGSIVNKGNTISAPIYKFTGNGSINIYIDGDKVLGMVIDSGGYITIDTETLEASANGVLKNRYVSGDYEKLRLKAGSTAISWDTNSYGSLTSVEISRYTRWI